MSNFPWKNKDFKCVVLCGGLGSRLLPLSLNKNKAMLEIAGKPILGHVIDYWKKYTNDFVFLVHYKKEDIIEYVKSLPINSEFIEVKELKGIADGLKYAKSAIHDNFVAVLGDCVLKGEFNFPEEFNHAVGVWRTENHDDIKRSFSVEHSDNKIIKVIEKPQVISNNLCGMGCYFFNKKIFDYIDKTPPSNLRNEIEITDSIQTAVDHGEHIHAVSFNGDYINVTYPEDLEKAERIFTQVV